MYGYSITYYLEGPEHYRITINKDGNPTNDTYGFIGDKDDCEKAASAKVTLMNQYGNRVLGSFGDYIFVTCLICEGRVWIEDHECRTCEGRGTATIKAPRSCFYGSEK